MSKSSIISCEMYLVTNISFSELAGITHVASKAIRPKPRLRESIWHLVKYSPDSQKDRAFVIQNSWAIMRLDPLWADLPEGLYDICTRVKVCMRHSLFPCLFHQLREPVLASHTLTPAMPARCSFQQSN